MAIRPQVRQLQAAGRRGDELLGHLTPGELVLPQSLQSPGIVAAIAQDARRKGINPSALMAGSRFSSVNPATGLPEFADQAGHEQTFEELVAEIVARAQAISGTPQLPGAPLPGGPAVPEGTEVPFFFDQVTDFTKFGFGPEALIRQRTENPFGRPPGSGGGGDTGVSAGTSNIDLSDFFDGGQEGIDAIDIDPEFAGDPSAIDPRELSLGDLLSEFTQGVFPDSFGEKVMKGVAGALSPGFGLVDAFEQARLKEDLEALQDIHGLFEGFTLDELSELAKEEANPNFDPTMNEGFAKALSGKEPGPDPLSPFGFDLDTIADAEAAAAAGTSLGGSAGDFEGVDFDTGLGGSAGDFEGVDFGPDDPVDQGFSGFEDDDFGDFDGDTEDPGGEPSEAEQDTEQEDEDPGADTDDDDDDDNDESDDTGGGGDTGD